ncbi:STAS domain protein [Phycisphaerae bacterium RAS2]|nr:STAS domain protein [Phycisphaerae bacterium RAS2]
MPSTISKYGNVSVITVKDELIGDEVDPFASQARKCMTESGHQVVIDGSTMTGLDSAALEALVALQNECEEQLGAVKFCALSSTCDKILEITRLARRFERFADLESAVKSFH